MLTSQHFVRCVADNLKAKGFGRKRIEEILDDFTQRVDGYTSQGKDPAAASQLAMADMWKFMDFEARERAKRTAKTLAVQASNIARIQQGVDAPVSKFLMDGKRGSKGTALARAAVSLIEDDARFNGTSYNGVKEAYRGQMYALLGDALETVGKGAFARQKGKAHLPNIAREIFGQSTGDAKAKAFADAWLRVADLTVELFNNAGGSMQRIARYMPQAQNAVKLARAGKDRWVRVHLESVDWSKTKMPSGRVIHPGERVAVLEKVYETLVTDGASKIDMTAFRGQGKAVGNTLDTHRFLHYKNGDAWLKVHEEFGEGNVFEVLVGHIETMAHKTALVETFGPNPEVTMMNIESIVRKAAADTGDARNVSDAEAILKNKFQPMMAVVQRENPMDPNSVFGNTVTGVANILTAAQLGSASLLAIPGDFMQAAAVRALYNQGMFNGTGMYMKALATDPKFMREIATQSGFVMDEVVMATYAQTRWTGVATVGPAATRFVSEAVMRASLMSGHTKAARWAAQSEFMGMMHRSADKPLNETPFADIARRHGITSEMWDALRQNVKAWEPRRDIKFMRPIDILQTQVPNRQAVYTKFQTMIFEEARRMIPEATIEGAVALKGTTRPDTLLGALSYSFSMYKNFPISFAMIYGRLGMTAKTSAGRLGFYAGLGAGMTLVGALGTQMREVSKGRDPLPMNDPRFLGKAFLSGGALSIWGDFLFAGVNEYNRGPQDIAAGPLVQFLGDTTDLLLGDVFQFAEALGGLSEPDGKGTFGGKAVEYARRYTPGTSIWWARAALSRQVFDRLYELADPRAYQKFRRQEKNRRQDYGQEHWWAPGEMAPDRAPDIGGAWQ